MKTLIHTIIVIAALSLLAAGFAPAQNVSGEEVSEVAVVFAQVQASGPAAPAEPVLLSIPSSEAPPPISPPVAATSNMISFGIDDALSFGLRSGSTGTVLVIPSEQTSTEDLLTINEDMSVMSRIFEKNLGYAPFPSGRPGFFGPRHDSLSMLLGGSRGGIQSMYLQGFGALFMMKVDFPLTPPPDMQDDEKETIKAEDGDPVWQQMRREMYEPENVSRYSRADRPEEKYDAEKVENLKTTLIKALKHAANIRSLKPDESVILTITGSSEATGTIIKSARLSGGNQIIVSERVADGKTITRLVSGTSLNDDIRLSSPSILVIRTKKSDIDEFAKGDLDFDRFRQRVQLLTHPLLGGAAECGSPLDVYFRSRSTGSSNRR